MAATKKSEIFDAWNPGIQSEIPARLKPLISLYRAENSSVDWPTAHERGQFCGMKPQEMVAFNATRLAIHEILVRVTADLYVADGPNYEDLGITLRSMASVIFERYVLPHRQALEGVLDQVRRDAAKIVERELQAAFAGSEKPQAPEVDKPSWLRRLFGRQQVAAAPQHGVPFTEAPIKVLNGWQERLEHCDSPLERACLEALVKLVGGIASSRGRVVGEPEFLCELAVNLVANTHGSEAIGDFLKGPIADAVAGEGYRVLPAQEKPVVMNVKGASAAGKSTVRARQRSLAERLHIPWEDFAVISPDYWRKMLIDYDGLGEDFKYAAMLTGQELEIIDRKLDGYMARKAEAKAISHLLIDRFRFDSFSLVSERPADSKLLTRFGERIFLFFMITPPTETVERAWSRGLTTGRYKAVDDLLFHNVEAYMGMPNLFFSWADSPSRKVHFEFLDNGVAKGERPRTIAFGWNGEMTILDLEGMLNIERFRKVNVEATRPDQVLDKRQMAAKDNKGFLTECINRISAVNFAHFDSGEVYGRAEDGKWVWFDEKIAGPGTVNLLAECELKPASSDLGWNGPAPEVPDADHAFTLGRWGVKDD